MTKSRNGRRLALKGDFSALPQPFLWEQSSRFAHFLDGYREAGGFNRAESPSGRQGGRGAAHRQMAERLGVVAVSVLRASRGAPHGSDPSNGDALCDALRHALQVLDPTEARSLAARFTPN